MDRKTKLTAAAMLLVGILFEGIGAYLLSDALDFTEFARPVVGEVTKVTVSESRDSETGRISRTYTPTFIYRDETGQTQTGKTHISSSSYDYSIGERVDILYDPRDPSDVRVDGLVSLYVFPVVFLIVGLLPFFIGAHIVRQALRQNRVGERLG